MWKSESEKSNILAYFTKWCFYNKQERYSLTHCAIRGKCTALPVLGDLFRYSGIFFEILLKHCPTEPNFRNSSVKLNWLTIVLSAPAEMAHLKSRWEFNDQKIWCKRWNFKDNSSWYLLFRGQVIFHFYWGNQNSISDL